MEIGPGTDGFDSSKLLHEDIVITVVFQSRVSLGNKVVTVVDDGIIIGRIVVTVVITYVKEKHVTQVTIGIRREVDQITANFSKEDGAIANGLQLVENADDTIDRVGGIIQVVLVCEDNVLRLLIEEIRAGCHTTNRKNCENEFIYLGNHILYPLNYKL